MKGLPGTSTSVLLLAAIFVYTRNNFVVRAAPIQQNSEKEALNHVSENQEEYEEEQLEKLKALPANVAVSETRTKTVTKVNGKTEMHRTKEETVEDTASGQTLSKISQHLIQTSDAGDGQPKTVLKTEVDIPSKGIHEVSVSKKPKKLQLKQQQEKMHQRASDGGTLDNLGADLSEDYYLPYDGVQYSPGDMAEYIRRTGDDEGVALAVEELMREGLMSRNDAASYLEEVKNELDFTQQDQFMKNNPAEREERNTMTSGQQMTRHQSLYLQQQPHQRESGGIRDDHLTGVQSMQRPQQQQRPAPSGGEQRHDAAPPTSSSGQTGSYNSLTNAKRSMKPLRGTSELGQSSEEDSMGGAMKPSDESNYSDLLERLRIADFLYKEYSLEEVIYQLAKEMFTQSIVKGNRDAEESLQRFSNFLQEETNEGRISKELETKILDVVMTALMVAVGGHPSPSEQPKGAVTSAATATVDRLRNAIGIASKPGRNPDANSLKNRVEKPEKSLQNKEQITYDKSNERRDAKV